MESVLEGLSSNRKNHELLHGQFVPCMRTSIYHIKGLRRTERRTVAVMRVENIRVILEGVIFE